MFTKRHITRLFCILTFWLARLGQLSPTLEQPNWKIQVDCIIPLDLIENFLRISPPLEWTHWLIRVYCQIFLDQFKNSCPTWAISLANSSWFSNLLRLSQALLQFWVIWFDRSKPIALSSRFSLSTLYISRDVIGSIYLRSCTSIILVATVPQDPTVH